MNLAGVRSRALGAAVVLTSSIALLSSRNVLAGESGVGKDGKDLPKCCQKKGEKGESCAKESAKPADAKAAPKSGTKKDETKKSDKPVAVKEAGMVVSIDPESGTLRPPTAEERRALDGSFRQSLNRSDEGLVVETHPDGRKHVNLEGRFMDMAVVRVEKDGRVVPGCVHDEAEASAFLSGTTPAPAVLEEK